MTKQDSVSAGLAAIQAAESAALGQCFDDGVASVVVAPGFTQADIDSAVATAVAAVKASAKDDLQKLEADIG